MRPHDSKFNKAFKRIMLYRVTSFRGREVQITDISETSNEPAYKVERFYYRDSKRCVEKHITCSRYIDALNEANKIHNELYEEHQEIRRKAKGKKQ